MANNRRAVVISELMPDGLEDLDQHSTEEIREAIKGFRSMPTQVSWDNNSGKRVSSRRVARVKLIAKRK